ncbi:polyadenylate-binding protein-interacting protein 1 isoform X1 [Polypterus senegalus]|uniref:polyadenylate-binding protein-interacting protein 1 isoform X1 n=1 Tax=Polypterus senegalus TaxID=55291 RepID=UPI00196608C5|nr:polyadenylate-binding protein-interacting protein 1 isoform X1 [Polypterus senegalus]
MTDKFDRAPGAERTRPNPVGPGLSEQDPRIPKTSPFQQEPLRQPKTNPSVGQSCAGGDTKGSSRSHPGVHEKYSKLSISTPIAKSHTVDSSLVNSRLSPNAPEFYPSTYIYAGTTLEDEGQFYGQSNVSLADIVQDFLNHLNDSPASFESDIESFTVILNEWVNTEEALYELVELIYQQATSVPNFSYTGARLCNHLSHHVTMVLPSGNFRSILLERCQKEYEKRNEAVHGDESVRKKFHSFVLFLGELYLNLEIKGSGGHIVRADILLDGLQELLKALLSKPVDSNLICAVKLLKLTGSTLEDAWAAKKKSHMDDLIQKIKTSILDATSSRDVRNMLMNLVELRSSGWGRVHCAASYSEATPENDPNYFMNEPTFYTEEGVPFTAADPEYSEKYQEMLDQEDFFAAYFEENGTDAHGGNDGYFEDEEEMDPEMEEAFEKFCLESQKK